MTKKELAKVIAEEFELPQLVALAVVQMVLDGITDALVNEGRVELRNFGIFEVKCRKPRKARNPRSGATVLVPERAFVRFKAGKEMKKQVRQTEQAVGH